MNPIINNSRRGLKHNIKNVLFMHLPTLSEKRQSQLAVDILLEVSNWLDRKSSCHNSELSVESIYEAIREENG